MAIQVSYPGVYVQVVTTAQPPTGGASTSVAAFVGRTPIGPINTATPTLNYASYGRTFGGLNKDSAISYQANAFFNNGGEQGLVVRLFASPTETSIAIGGTPVTADTFTLEYEINGGTLTPVSVTGQTTAAGVATALAAAINADSTLGTIVQATVDGSVDTQIDIAISKPVASIDGAPPAVSFVASVTSTTSPPPSMTIASPATIGAGLAGQADTWIDLPGAAAVPLFNQTKATATYLAGATYQLFFTPTGGAAVEVDYAVKSTDTTATDVAVGLYNAIKANVIANSLVDVGTSPPTTGDLPMSYKAAVQITAQVEGGSDSDLVLARTAVPSILPFAAANGGLWGDGLTVAMTSVPATQSELYASFGLSAGVDTQRMFNLQISYFDGTSYQSESFLNVTFAGDQNQSNRVDKILAQGSQYLRYPGIPSSQTLANSPSLAEGTSVGFGAGGVDSAPLTVDDYIGNAAQMTGLYALNQLPYGFNILCVPADAIDLDSADQNAAVYQEAAQICVDNNAMLIIDPPNSWYLDYQQGNVSSIQIDDPLLGSYTDEQGRSAAVYFPRVVIADPLANGQPKVLPPCGFMAAGWAATDAAVGVWKAPAGLDVPIGGIIDLQANLNDVQNGVLNPQGINVLRSFKTGGDVIWGARTLRGADVLGDEYKYVPVRRLLLFIETSLLQDTQWAVFQPNGQELWSKLQTQVSTFMAGLFSQGAFAGTSQSQAFQVKCDATTTTAADQASGIVNVTVAFAPLYPAEFVVITISQQAAASGG